MSVADAGMFLNEQIMRAMDNNLLQVTPGDITDTNFWKVDYRASHEAYKLARSSGPERIEEDAWRNSEWLKGSAGWKFHENWKMYDPARRDRRQELLKVRPHHIFVVILEILTFLFIKEKLEGMGKGDLYDKWRTMVQANTTTPTGASTSVGMKLINDHLAFFEREGIPFGPIGEEIDRQINAEFESTDMPVGF